MRTAHFGFFIILLSTTCVFGQNATTTNFVMNQTVSVSTDPPTTLLPTLLPDAATVSFFSENETFVNVRLTAFAAAIFSGLFGNPLTSAHVARSTTLINMCRPAVPGVQALSHLPLMVPLGSDELTEYYAGAAIMNFVFLLALAGVEVGFAYLVAFAKGIQSQQALSASRFPGMMVFPFMILLHPSVMNAATVLVESPSTLMTVLCSVMLAVWAAFIGVTAWFLLKYVPQKAKFVRNFREGKNDRFAREAVARMKADYETQRKLFDELSKRREERKRLQAEGLYEKGDAEKEQEEQQQLASKMLSQMKHLLGGITDTISKTATSLGEKFLGKEDDEGDTAPKLEDDDDEEERKQKMLLIKRSAMATYGGMLAAALAQRQLDSQDGPLQIISIGPHRWIDRPTDDKPAQGDEEDSEEEDLIEGFRDFVDTDKSLNRTGFIHMFGRLFRKYEERCFWFIIVEFVMCCAFGFIEGWRPSGTESDSCLGPALCAVVLLGSYTAAQIVLRPYISGFTASIALIITLLQFAGACFMLAAIVRSEEWPIVAAWLLSVLCVFTLLLQALFDIYIALAPLVSAKETAWTTPDHLTASYFDPNGVFGGVGDKKKMNELEMIASKSKHGVQLQLTVVDEEESGKLQWIRLGGRRAGFVGSRGVPVAYHPFVQKPLPPRIEIPQRDPKAIAQRKRRALHKLRSALVMANIKHMMAVPEEQQKQQQDDQQEQQNEQQPQGHTSPQIISPTTLRSPTSTLALEGGGKSNLLNAELDAVLRGHQMKMRQHMEEEGEQQQQQQHDDLFGSLVDHDEIMYDVLIGKRSLLEGSGKAKEQQKPPPQLHALGSGSSDSSSMYTKSFVNPFLKYLGETDSFTDKSSWGDGRSFGLEDDELAEHHPRAKNEALAAEAPPVGTCVSGRKKLSNAVLADESDDDDEDVVKPQRERVRNVDLRKLVEVTTGHGRSTAEEHVEGGILAEEVEMALLPTRRFLQPNLRDGNLSSSNVGGGGGSGSFSLFAAEGGGHGRNRAASTTSALRSGEVRTPKNRRVQFQGGNDYDIL